MSRVSYFKNVNPTIGLDATQNQMLNTLQGQIATKAEASALTSGLAQKADSSAVSYSLASKADASVVSTLSADLASEVADRKTAIADEVSARDGAVVALGLAVDAQLATKTNIGAVQDKFNQVNGVIATKLASSIYDARIVNEAVFFDSVKNSIVFNDAAGVELDYAALGLVPA